MTGDKLTLGFALAQGELSVGQLLEAQQTLLAVSGLPQSPKEKPNSKRARVDAALLPGSYSF
ncbi:MAG: hypothetical protein WCI05_10480 [Myxococcales bacterium]